MDQEKNMLPRTAIAGVRPRSAAALAIVVLVACALLTGGGTARAATPTPGPGWLTALVPVPSKMKAGSTGNQVRVRATNVGGAATSGAFSVAVALPTGMTPTAIRGSANGEGILSPAGCDLTTATCTYSSAVGAGKTAVVELDVDVAPTATGDLALGATVSGGGAPTATRSSSVPVGTPGGPLTLVDHATRFFGVDGKAVTQAGSHPWSQVTSFSVSQHLDPLTLGLASDDAVKDIKIDLPEGFVGNPAATPRCDRADFQAGAAGCPVDTQVGVGDAQVGTFGSTSDQIAPLYNLKPPKGYVADFAFVVLQVPVHILIRVRSESDYGLEAIIPDVSSSVELLGSTVTLWGVPADPSHDAQRYQRGSAFFTGEASGAPAKPFLSMPTSCPGTPLRSTALATSWSTPETVATRDDEAPALTGCDGLRFEPSVSVQPETTQADAPSGYAVTVHVPQTDDPGRLATPTLRKAVVALPDGVSLSPAVAGGLVACTDEQGAVGRAGDVTCPAASRIGTVTIDTPVLPGPLEGAISVGTQEPGDPFRIFLSASGYGVQVKLRGSIAADPSTGRLVTTFDDAPQLPFSDLTLRFKGGGRAPLANPTTCGVKTTTSALTSWASDAAATPTDAFTVSWDGAGAACPAALPFALGLSAGSTSPQAGAYSPFSLTVTRDDRQQELSTIATNLPAGLLGAVASVPQCADADAAAGTCPEASRVGSSTVAAGAGSQPLTLDGGRVYLAGPYKGAPFSLSIVVPTKAGPFDLGTVVVRAPIVVDAAHGTLAVAADPLPRILLGVPLRLRRVTITLDRDKFMFNPTSCAPSAVTATLGSTEGAIATPTNRFQAGGCGDLPFAPRLTATTNGRTTRARGASLHVGIAFGAGQANLRSVAVRLPLQFGARLIPTVNKACVAAQFAKDPKGCPAESLVGSATARTPVLTEPLTGPAYIVAIPGKLPKLVLKLAGAGVALTLEGMITADRVTGRIIATFSGIPDVPLTAFDLDLPQGPHSVLETVDPLCGNSVTLGVAAVAQSGRTARVAEQPVTVVGCPVSARATASGKTGIKVKVSSPGKGKLTVTGSGLRTAKRSATKAGSYTITTRLTAKARATLARRGRLTVKVRVTYAPSAAGGKRQHATATVKLKSARR
jgi:hypothetical protein